MYPQMPPYEPVNEVPSAPNREEDDDDEPNECLICKETVHDFGDGYRPISCHVAAHVVHRTCFIKWGKESCVACDPLGDHVPREHARQASVFIAAVFVASALFCAFLAFDSQCKQLENANNMLQQLRRFNQEGYRCAEFDENNWCTQWNKSDPKTEIRAVPSSSGIACWDLNMNKRCDLDTEDINNDADCSLEDCKAAPPPERTQRTNIPIVNGDINTHMDAVLKMQTAMDNMLESYREFFASLRTTKRQQRIFT